MGGDDKHQESEHTGRFRLIVREEIEGWGNGSLKRLEKGQRWTKAVLFYLALMASAGAALWKWYGTIAKREEMQAIKTNVDGVREDVSVLSHQVKDQGKTLGDIKKIVERRR